MSPHGAQDRAWIITGPTSGIGRETALEMANYGTVILVGRNPAKLQDVAAAIQHGGGRSVAVECDLADVMQARRAADEIAGLGLALDGLVNNAGMGFSSATPLSPQGWDLTFATNHLGPFALTEALVPHLSDGANIVFICSGVEDPERKPARTAGFRGGRYISAEASARGEWEAGGAKRPGYDAYATSKQGNLAATFVLAGENSRVHVNAIEPGFCPGTDLGRDANLALRLLVKAVLVPLAPHITYWSTPRRAAQVISRAVINEGGVTGVYCDETGEPMRASAQVSDPAFAARYIAETRALLDAGT